MASEKPELKRDGTMQVTAKEGIQYLKASGDYKILERQGLADVPEESEKGKSPASSSKPRMIRDNTMKATVKEGEQYLKEKWNNDSKKEQKQDAPLADKTTKSKSAAAAAAATPTTPIKPKLAKFNTMLQTKKEGETFLATRGGDIDDDAKTRNQQDKIDKLVDEPVNKKAKIVNERKPSVKRVSTLLKTAKEGEELLKELGHKDTNPESDRRQTRSQTRGSAPPPPPPKQKQNNAKKDGPKRPQGRPRKEKKEKETPKEEDVSEDAASKDDENENDEAEETKNENDMDEEEDEEENEGENDTKSAEEPQDNNKDTTEESEELKD